MPQIVKLQQGGGVSQLDLNIGYVTDTIKVQGDEVQKIYEYYSNGKTITVFGHTSGRAGFENVHELPHPIENDILFDDVFIVAHVHNIPLEFSVTDYVKFQKKFLGEVDDLGSEDTWSLAESVDSDDSIHEFVCGDDDFGEFDEVGTTDDELEDDY